MGGPGKHDAKHSNWVAWASLVNCCCCCLNNSASLLVAVDLDSNTLVEFEFSIVVSLLVDDKRPRALDSNENLNHSKLSLREIADDDSVGRFAVIDA